MSAATTPTEGTFDPFQLLPKALFRSVAADLYAAIPPPDLADPALIAERVHAAMATIASMVPANADEISIATRVVTADAQAKDCIRQARQTPDDPVRVMKCHAQANHMMRTANAARSLLLRVQSARHRREATPVTCEQDAWTIRATEGLFLDADGHPPVPHPPPPPDQPPPPEPAHVGDKFARYDAAEQYAVLHPRRTAEIRAHGGVPPTARYGPPDEDLVRALLASTSPLIRQIDEDHAPTPAA